MTFHQWLYSQYPNPKIDGRYGPLHIHTFAVCLLMIVLCTLLMRKRTKKSKRIFLSVYALLILFFEITRRIIHFQVFEVYDLSSFLSILLPRPGCAIACWLVMIAVAVNKKAMYNLAGIIAFLCGLAFFLHPGAGFHNEYILFENAYSIITHVLLFSSSVFFITLGFTDYNTKDLWQDVIGLATVFIYSLIEIFVIKIDSDPFFYMPQSQVRVALGMPYGVFLPLYILVIGTAIALFYFIPYIKKTISNKRRKA